VLDVAAVFLAAYLCYKLCQKRQHQYHLPPGPKGLPILGNSLQIPSSYAWEKYLKWGRQYSRCVYPWTGVSSQVQKDSDIIHLTVPGGNIVVANSQDVGVELLSKSFLNMSQPSPIQSTGKRSSIYSSWPILPMLIEL
jgi:hypothetical protein